LQKVPFDPVKDLAPITLATNTPNVVVVHPAVPAKTIKELIALSAAKPLTYAGSSGVGATVHIGMERFSRLSGLKAKYVAYKGSAPAILALMGGEINMAGSSAMAAVAAIQTGKVRGLASLGLKRLPALPDLPTVAEQGYPGFSVTNSYVLWAPVKTPTAIINAINQVVTEGMNAPEIEKQLISRGSEAVDPMTPKEVRAAVTKDYGEIEQVVKDLGITF
jgi:tripartite-type tricarboxylate transporter receptor subunit TctC